MVGRTEADARQLLENPPYSFVVSVTTEETNDVAAGLVIRTNPSVGTLVDIGGSITLVVSSGAPAVDVPNVIGQTESAARSQLAAFDVSVSYQDLPAGDGNDGKVIAQSIAGGQQAPAGSSIQLTVGRAAAPTADGGADDHRRADHDGGADDDHDHDRADHRRRRALIGRPPARPDGVGWGQRS